MGKSSYFWSQFICQSFADTIVPEIIEIGALGIPELGAHLQQHGAPRREGHSVPTLRPRSSAGSLYTSSMDSLEAQKTQIDRIRFIGWIIEPFAVNFWRLVVQYIIKLRHRLRPYSKQ